MGESVLLHQRCLAIKLVREHPPPTRPHHTHHACTPSRPPHTCTPTRPTSVHDVRNATEPRPGGITTPTSSSTGSDTPTNGPSPASLPTSNLATPSATNHITNYQDGYLLFLAWQTANSVCVWDKELLMAVQEAEFVGHLVGDVLLVGGSSSVLVTLTHAWSRALLAAPTGFTITMLGEISGCSVVKVPQGQFTPLADALCWVIYRLTKDGGRAEAETVQASLTTTFPSLNAPDPAHVHTVLSNLIRQCKVYYTGHSYGIVHPDTYQLTSVPEKSPDTSFALSLATPSTRHPLACLDSANHMCIGGMSHSAAQTDLAELITGSAQPSDKVIIPTPTPPGSWSGGSAVLERQASLRVLSSHRTHNRTSSLRLSPTKAALLATAFGNSSSGVSSYACNTYQAHDMSDITVKAGERGSVLSKLLRVSPRRRLGSFSAQFPPPEWGDDTAPAVHVHCVAVQTLSQRRQEDKESWWCSTSQWTPRSATLPRRLRRPQSATPPPSQRSDSSSPAHLHSSCVQIQGSLSPYHSYVHSQASPLYYTQMSAKEGLDRLVLESSPLHRCGEPVISCRNHRHRSPVRQNYENHKHRSPVHQNYENHKHRSPVHQNIENHKHRSPVHQNYEKKKNHSDQLIESSPSRQTLDNRETTKKQTLEHPTHHAESRTSANKLPAHATRKQSTHPCRTPEEERVESLGETYIKTSGEEPTKSREDLVKGSGENTEKRAQGEHTPGPGETPPSSQPHRHKSHHCLKGKNQKQQESNHRNHKRDREKRESKDGRHDSKDVMIGRVNVEEITQKNQLKYNKYTSCESKDEKNKKMLDMKEGEKEKQFEISQGGNKPDNKDEKWNENCQQHEKDGSVKSEGGGRYNRLSLQLDLAVTNMNNSRKVVSSPQRPEVLKNNLLHGDGELTHVKGSCQDLTSRNLGYQEVDKCHKQMCSQTLDQVQQQSVSQGQQSHVTSNTKQQQHPRSPKKKSSPGTDVQNVTSIIPLENEKTVTKDVGDTSPNSSVKDPDKPGSSPDTGGLSVSTYPSLSELNLNFSSLAAQKILCGASVNSIDTLVEVNLAAEKRNFDNNKHSDSVTSTDFGFL
ncbi:uncharacterized protein LOC121879763 isoform X1 [Homarus americanus]|uniref:uncharacterized protein LOC121879763 isoform X1 n=1 Tax=Homarus americanus TaxID=6706 RepID=UPI001C48A19F|nr:uncharacterized protein LOC121879763 isoform X1 [Homarus americanus]